VLRERFECVQREASAGRTELDMREERLSRKEREFKCNMHDVHETRTQLTHFKEQIASWLNDCCDSTIDFSEEAIRCKILSIKTRNTEMASVRKLNYYSVLVL
jgi:hypothetical protein